MPVKISNGLFSVAEDMNDVVQEVNLSSLDLRIHQLKLERFLRKTQARTLINGEGISPYIFMYEKLSSVMGLKNIRMQTAEFTPNDAADFCFSDGLVLDSQNLKQEFFKKFPENTGQIHYLGDSALVLSPREKERSGETNIVFFSQFHDPENTRKLIETLITFSSKNPDKVSVFIKPHPRDHTDYSAMTGVEVLPKEEPIDRCIAFATFAVSRSSSVLSRALLLGTPYLACQVHEIDRYLQSDFVAPELNAVVTSHEQFEAVLNNLNDYIRDFYTRREKMIKSRLKSFDYDSFIDLIRNPKN